MIYRFSDFELDEEAYELRRGSTVVHLFPKAFDVLLHLVKNPDRVVSKEELLARVWRGEYVSTSVLPVNIRTIRVRLRDGHAKQIVETVRGRGYRIARDVRVVSPERAPSQPEAPSAGFFGREKTLETLTSALREAEGGSTRVVLIHGDSGMGKSRLLEEFAHQAAQDRVLIIAGHCRDDPGAPPYWPIFQLLRSADTQLASSELRRAIARSRFDLERARKRVSELVGRDIPRQMNPEAVRFRLTQTLFRAGEELARVVPIVVMIDDLHAADASSIRVIGNLIGRAGSQRVLMIGTYRDSEADRGSPLHSLEQELGASAHVTRIPLLGLEKDAIAAFAEQQLGARPSRQWVRVLAKRTEGNPFFLLETLRLLRSTHTLSAESDPEHEPLELPETVRDVLERRFERCTDDCRTLLRWAAVIGSRVSISVLTQASKMAPEPLFAGLEEALAARILSDRAADLTRLELGEYRFPHALLRETLYQELTPGQRVQFHRAVGEALERLGAAETPDGLSELAHHFYGAAPGGTGLSAISYAKRAGELAIERHAYDDAVSHFRMALRAESFVPERSAASAAETRLALADSLWRAGRYSDAEQEFERVCSAAESLGRFDLLGRAALGRMAWPQYINFDLFGRTKTRTQWLARIEDALAHLPEGEAMLRSRLMSALARGVPSAPDRIRLTHDAVALARTTQSPEALFDALMTRMEAQRGPDSLTDRMTIADEALRVAQAMGSAPLVFVALEARTNLALALGDMARVDADVRACADIAARLRVPVYRYTVERFEMLRALGDGRMSEVKERRDRLLRLGERATDRTAPAGHAFTTLWLRAVQGELHKSRDSIDQLVDRGFVQTGAARTHVALLYMDIRDRSRCADLFEKVATDDFAALERNDEWLWYLSAAADVSTYLRDRERGERLYSLLLPYAGVNCVHSTRGYRGAAAHSLGVLARLLGRHHAAKEHFEHALAFNERIGARPYRLMVQYQYAALLARGPLADEPRRTALLESANAEAEQLGIETWFARYR